MFGSTWFTFMAGLNAGGFVQNLVDGRPGWAALSLVVAVASWMTARVLKEGA